MATDNSMKKEYDEQAGGYEGFYSAPTPLPRLETELFLTALGKPTGAKVLDLGGGTGLRSRQALDAGATSADIVDISPAMMQEGQVIGARNELRWFEADVSKPLDHIPELQPASYDLVMINWVFDHAKTVEMLEGMWRNIATYLKPGGLFINVRCGDPYAPAMVSGETGLFFKDHVNVPGGVHYRYKFTRAPIHIEAASMEISYSGSTELHTKYGLENVEVMPYEDTEVYKEDPEFWKSFLANPGMAVVKARKKL